MSKNSHDSGQAAGGPVKLVDKLAGSDSFKSLFQDGMALVEETAAYLDGPGREESKVLSRAGSLAYAAESMRLTTRLMQMASWLLLQRAVNDGEMSTQQAKQEKSKVKFDLLSTATEGPGWDDIPEKLRDLILRSGQMQNRLRHLDSAIYDDTPDAPSPDTNPVAAQLNMINQAFNTKN